MTALIKDLRLAVWLAMGGLHRSGWSGFVRGLISGLGGLNLLGEVGELLGGAGVVDG
jgi:hypothetical protein